MFTSRFPIKVVTVMTVLIMALSSVQPVLAAPPINDDFGNATLIASLPFTDTIDTSEATAAFDDPTTCTNNGSVWYLFTPSTDMAIEADTFGSFYDTVLSVYTGTQGALTQVPGGCNDDFTGGQSRVVFNAIGGTTYYFLLGRCCGSGGNGGGSLTFSVQELLPPTNDNFTSATAIPSPLPFDDATDISGATVEIGEPSASCAYNGANSTVWYAFTSTITGSVSARFLGISFSPLLAAYTGNSLASLTEVSCQPNGNVLTLHVDAGSTYYFQIGALYPGQGGFMQFHVEVTPPPQVNISYSPGDPSIFDNVSFYASAYDPGQIYGFTYAWTISDGTTSDQQVFNHQFASDGDYTVNLTATTSDGRSASPPSQLIQVRTHDVSINKLVIPQTARVNQTKAISVEIKNNRYSEYVQVTLIKGLPGGGEQVIGHLTLYVPARATKPTIFKFSYTFTPEDATIGKVTFKTIATIVDSRDALSSDNTVIGTTLVSR